MSQPHPISIKIEKINSSTFQLTKISSAILLKISDRFSFLPPGYRFNPLFRLLGIKGVKARLINSNGTFPAGLFGEVVEFITDVLHKKVVMSNDVMEHFLPLTDFFEGGIHSEVFSEFEIDSMPVILRDYQLGAVQSAFENRNCLLNLSTGAGKCLGGNTVLDVKLPAYVVQKYKHLLAQ